MQNSFYWGMSSPPVPTPNRNPFHAINRVISIADFQTTWNPRRPPSTSSSSSSSYDPGIYTPSSRKEEEESKSRTPTPTPPRMAFSPPAHNETAHMTSPNNPWAKILATKEATPPISPGSSASPDSLSAGDLSRSATPTPFAPQPRKPFIADPVLVAPRDDFPAPYPFAPIPFVTKQPAGGIPYTVGFDDKLLVQFITPELITQNHRRIPQIALRQGWKAPQLVYQWALKHYRIAFLLWMANDLQAWPKAMMMGLEDAHLPCSEEDLRGIATNISKVLELQWKIAIKQLPRDGRHTELKTKESVPLETQPNLRMDIAESQKKTPKRMDCVKFCDKTTDVVFVRKRIDIKNVAEKEAILAQIREYHHITHANIAKIAGSYARGQTVAILSARAETNLVNYLDTFAGPSEAEQLLSWIQDLCSALMYLHDNKVTHRSIRPNKILVDTQKRHVMFSVFGIAQPARASGTALFSPYSTEPAYVYAAPETISRRESGTAADVFSLGCVLLEMATAAKGLEIEALEAYRSTDSHDASYHMNLGRVDSWTQKLRLAKSTSRRRLDRHAAAIDRVLNAVRAMVSNEPSQRPSIRDVAGHLKDVKRPRRRSDVTAEIGRAAMEHERERARERETGNWPELETLDRYYHQSFGGQSQHY